MKPIVTDKEKAEYYFKDKYYCTVDTDQKKKHQFKGEDGKEYLLYIAIEQNKNHRIAHPNYGLVEACNEGAQFPVGTTLIVRHFTFEDEAFKSLKAFTKDDKDYYKATNFDIMFGVIDGEIIPREGVLLCEPVYGDLVETTLELLPTYKDARRDIAKVLKVWEGCEEFEVGDYVMLAKGGDYHFTHEGKDYIKVDHFFNDAIAIVDSPEWRIDELLTHAKDHNEITYI